MIATHASAEDTTEEMALRIQKLEASLRALCDSCDYHVRDLTTSERIAPAYEAARAILEQ